MLQSIYTHAGCDYGCLYTYSPRHCFNPHTHAGCDLFVHLQCVQNMFQSTHPRRVWHRERYTLPQDTSFNPHTHAGCDITVLNSRPSNQVSIHTPTQGVTRYSINQFKIWMFQSTHPRRVWHWCFCFPLCGIFLFQSTHPRRVWLRFRHCLKESLTCFNPHTHAGCDKNQHLYLIPQICFNPHTHAGCDSL